MNEENINATASESRYRALLSVSSVLAEQSDVRAVLHSVSLLLSKIVGFDRVALLLLNENEQGARLYALESELGSSDMAIGQDVSYAGTSWSLALESQRAVYIPRLNEDLARSPDLLQHVCIRPTTSAYVFPISSARSRIAIYSLRDYAECSS
jgi:transcriptional regulator with GAF, ATPase, and Fis domain